MRSKHYRKKSLRGGEEKSASGRWKNAALFGIGAAALGLGWRGAAVGATVGALGVGPFKGGKHVRRSNRRSIGRSGLGLRKAQSLRAGHCSRRY